MAVKDKIFITKHAKTRFIQRCRLFLKNQQKDYQVLHLMKTLIREGYWCYHIDSTPFYKNRLGCRIINNGRYRFYIKGNRVVTFVYCQRDEQYLDWRR